METAQIPDKRLQGAENYGTWGGHMWQDFYARTPLDWADSEIRGLNGDLQKEPGNMALIGRRDIMYQWRNAYLAEYTSFDGTPMDPKLDAQFEKLLKEKIEEVYAGKKEQKEEALRKYEAFKNARKDMTALKRLPSDESGIVGVMK